MEHTPSTNQLNSDYPDAQIEFNWAKLDAETIEAI